MKWIFYIFMALYVMALLLFLVGIYGWFGQEQDPLSGIFLLPLGLPWNLLADRMGMNGVATVTLAPMLNIGILVWLWRR